MDYIVASLFKSYLNTIGIIMHSLKSIGNSNMPKLTKKANSYGGIYPNYRKASL